MRLSDSPNLRASAPRLVMRSDLPSVAGTHPDCRAIRGEQVFYLSARRSGPLDF